MATGKRNTDNNFYLPSDVIRIKEISAGVPIKAPVAPATTPGGVYKNVNLTVTWP